VIAGIGLAVLVTRRRNRKDGGRPGLVLDVAAWAVPFGLAGVFLHALLLDAWHHSGAQSTLLHTAAEAVAAIGVPGAMVLGAAGAWIACHRAGVPLDPVAKAAAPGVAFGLAVGALGRWWTQNFYGHPASWLLAVRILPVHRVPGYENFATFQPAFLYQSAWDLAMGLALIWAVRRFALTGARTFMLAAAGYGLGGLWMESVRIGPQLRVFGMLFDVWADLVVIVVATVLFVLTRPRQRPPYKVPLAGARRVM
jgi:prolipoprotein diacylglyceryltransferase